MSGSALFFYCFCEILSHLVISSARIKLETWNMCGWIDSLFFLSLKNDEYMQVDLGVPKWRDGGILPPPAKLFWLPPTKSQFPLPLNHFFLTSNFDFCNFVGTVDKKDKLKSSVKICVQFKWKYNIFIWTIAFLYDILQNFPFFNLNVLLKYIFITNKAWIRSYCVFTGQIGKIVLYPSPKIGVSIPHPPNLPKRGENLAPPLKFRKGNPVDIEKVYMKGNFDFGIFQPYWLVDLVFKIFHKPLVLPGLYL